MVICAAAFTSRSSFKFWGLIFRLSLQRCIRNFGLEGINVKTFIEINYSKTIVLPILVNDSDNTSFEKFDRPTLRSPLEIRFRLLEYS